MIIVYWSKLLTLFQGVVKNNVKYIFVYVKNSKMLKNVEKRLMFTQPMSKRVFNSGMFENYGKWETCRQ